MTEDEVRSDERDEIIHLLEAMECARSYKNDHYVSSDAWADGVEDASEAVKDRGNESSGE